MSNIPEFEMNDPLFHFYNKKEVEAFRVLVDKERIFSQKFIDEQAEKGWSPELAGVLAGIGAGAAALGIAVPVAIGVVGTAVVAEGGAVAAGGAGMAGGAAVVAEGAAGAGAAAGLGAVGVVAAVALPLALIGGGLVYGTMSQNKLKRALKELIGLSYEYEEILKLDRREGVIDLLAYVRVARDKYIK